MFLLENKKIFTKDRVFQIEYKKPLDEFLDGHWVSYYCMADAMIEIGSGSLTKCIKSILNHEYSESSNEDFIEMIKNDPTYSE